MSPSGPNSRRVLNQSTHVKVANSTGLEGAPRALPLNHLRLVQADHRFGEGIVIGIALAADRRRDAASTRRSVYRIERYCDPASL